MLRTAGLALLLFLVNWSIAGDLFFIDYIAHMTSIEGTHIARGRS